MAQKGIIKDSSELPGPVLWPNVASADSVDDLAPPLRLLLIDLGISPRPEDASVDGFAKAGIDVPPSVAIIEAGATEFSKAAAAQLKGLGGVAGVAALVAGFWSKANLATRLVGMAGGAFVLAAALIAIAVIVSSDVRARGMGASAQYGARALVAEAYLRGAVSLAHPAATGSPAPSAGASPPGSGDPLDARAVAMLVAASTENGMSVTLKNGESHNAKHVRYTDGAQKIEIKCGRDEWRGLDEIVTFEAQ